jgi:hypothetical protein
MSALGLSVFKKEKFSAEVKDAGMNVRKRIMITLFIHTPLPSDCTSPVFSFIQMSAWIITFKKPY